jgi:hypothetical protein
MMSVQQLMRNRAAIKFLMGLGTNPELTAKDQRMLRPYVSQGMTTTEARATLKRIGWKEE